MLSRGKVQTIEQTGKIWKLQQALAAGVIIVGIVLLVFAFNDHSLLPSTTTPAIAITLLIAGTAWLIIARIIAWWHHG